MIGTKIKEYLVMKGIKQTFVAEKSGLTPTIMSDICNKDRKIDVVEYAKICKALDLPLDYFLDDIE